MVVGLVGNKDNVRLSSRKNWEGAVPGPGSRWGANEIKGGETSRTLSPRYFAVVEFEGREVPGGRWALGTRHWAWLAQVVHGSPYP
jgi:hypothetical protein